ncbi:MAG: hypothetical protein QM703_22800 [Gemmatales bacterium]
MTSSKLTASLSSSYALRVPSFAYESSGGLGVAGVASLKQGFTYRAVGRLGLAGVATASQASNWQLIDTFTGADFTVLNGTTCDTGQTRTSTFNPSAGQIYNNKGYAYTGSTTWTYTLTNAPTQLKWTTGDGGDHGLLVDFYFLRSVDGSQSFMIRINGGSIGIFKNGSPTSWTTGTSTGGYGNSISLTVDLTTDLITLTVDDSGMGHQVLTYSEVGMPNTTNKTLAVFTWNYIDNIYVK